MKDKLITPRKNKPTLINLDILCCKSELDELRTIKAGEPTETLFSLVLANYIKSKAKEFRYFPAPSKPEDYEGYTLIFFKKDGSKSELAPFPKFFFRNLLKSFKEQKIINYDPYSDERQCSLIETKYRGKTCQLELCVQQSKYGREIVVRKK